MRGDHLYSSLESPAHAAAAASLHHLQHLWVFSSFFSVISDCDWGERVSLSSQFWYVFPINGEFWVNIYLRSCEVLVTLKWLKSGSSLRGLVVCPEGKMLLLGQSRLHKGLEEGIPRRGVWREGTCGSAPLVVVAAHCS